MVIPLFSSLIYVMDLRSPVLKAYRKVSAVLGEAYTTHGAELYCGRVYQLSKPVDAVKDTHLRCLSEWTRLTSSERSRLGLKSAYQPEPCVIYSELTSSAFECTQSSVEGSESDGGRNFFSDSAGAPFLSVCHVRL